MSKKLSLGFMIGLFLFAQAGLVHAVPTEKTFTVTANIPAATAINITPYIYSPTRTLWTGLLLTFDPMILRTSGIWLPDQYYGVEVTTTGGAGSTDIYVIYAEGANPNSAGTGHGLGWKSTATFMSVNGTAETQLTSHGPKKMLKDVTNEHITPTDLGTGFLRVYLGIVTKDPNALIPDPALSEPFTNADKSGTYDGTVKFSVTLL